MARFLPDRNNILIEAQTGCPDLRSYFTVLKKVKSEAATSLRSKNVRVVINVFQNLIDVFVIYNYRVSVRERFSEFIFSLHCKVPSRTNPLNKS